MAKKITTDWHILGRRILLRAKKQSSGSIILKSTSDAARGMYKFYIEETGADVTDELKPGMEVYISLPGLASIEGVTDDKAEETFFFIDYNFIYLFKNV